MPAIVVKMIGGLAPTFLLSRIFVWLFRYQASRHLRSGAHRILAGSRSHCRMGASDGVPYRWDAGFTYIVPQLFGSWLTSTVRKRSRYEPPRHRHYRGPAPEDVGRLVHRLPASRNSCATGRLSWYSVLSQGSSRDGLADSRLCARLCFPHRQGNRFPDSLRVLALTLGSENARTHRRSENPRSG